MTTWFISDTHFCHRRIIELAKRPFRDADEMDEAMVQRWNARVAPQDTVWHLGDFVVSSNEAHAAAIFWRLNGTKHLIVGNHDEDAPATLALPWASIDELARIEVDGQKIMLCHYPMRTWPDAQKGAIHLFGHMHGRLSGTDLSCDMGVELWDYRPASLVEIRARLRRQKPDPDFRESGKARR